MNHGITVSYLIAVFIKSFPALWVAITLVLTTIANKLINKIGEKKRMLLIADKAIILDNERLSTENEKLKKTHLIDKKAIEKKDSQINRLDLIIVQTAANMRGAQIIIKG